MMSIDEVDTKTIVVILGVGDFFNINGDWFKIARGSVTCYSDGTINQPEDVMTVNTSYWEAVDSHEEGCNVYESTARFIGTWRDI